MVLTGALCGAGRQGLGAWASAVRELGMRSLGSEMCSHFHNPHSSEHCKPLEENSVETMIYSLRRKANQLVNTHSIISPIKLLQQLVKVEEVLWN